MKNSINSETRQPLSLPHSKNPLQSLLRKIDRECRERERRGDLQNWANENIVFGNGREFGFIGHEYLREIYGSTCTHIVIEKASQMGISTYSLCRSIWASIKRGMKVIYYFPTMGDVSDFSQDRFPSLIKPGSAFHEIVRGADRKVAQSVGMKRLGRGMLYFRGLFHSDAKKMGLSGTKTKSVDADMIVFDELDEAQPHQKDAAKHRIDHSYWKWLIELSTPTIPDYGIDKEFKKSDQRYWHLICPHCKAENCVEETFPQCLTRREDGSVFLSCKHCQKALEGNRGMWVPHAPSMHRLRGYHISQLYSPVVDLQEILDEYEDPTVNMQLFYNHRLGLPFLNSLDRVTMEGVYSCCQPSQEMKTASKCSWMGVDQGFKLHFVIMGLGEEGRLEITSMGTAMRFEQLDRLMEQFGVQDCVIDALPNQHSARDFAHRHPGQVRLSYYNAAEGKKSMAPFNLEDEINSDYGINLNRTETLDSALALIHDKRITLPRRSPIIDEFAIHLYNLIKVRQEDPISGQVKFRYIKIGADHYGHALNYAFAAYNQGNGGGGECKGISGTGESSDVYISNYDTQASDFGM